MKKVLTIAGSDSGGGAGIQADLKAFLANGVYGMSVITAVTAQNTTGVYGVHAVPAAMVRTQFDVVADDIGIDAVKTGMLAEVRTVEVVADCLRRRAVGTVVVDPVMVATSGSKLIADEAVDAVRTKMMPLATLLTPNLPEASVLLGREVTTPEEAKRAAYDLCQLGPQAVLVKGGHLAAGEAAVDILYDGSAFHAFGKPWLDTKSTHGTGCTLASAAAAWLARGLSVDEAVLRAKNYVYDAMRHATPMGSGHGPLNHGFALQ